MLIPASDCAFHSLTLPAGLRKPPLQVAPFLLEEQLADDVEATHFALLHRQQAQCEIVAVQRQKMRDWLARCESLSLQPLALTPDVLALPWQPPAWSAVQVDEQWLIRHQPWGGMAAENVWLTELLQSEAEEHVIDSYSPPPAAPGVWREQPAQTLLTLAARHPAAQKLSLLQGSSPSGGGLRRRAGVRRGMPRWLWRYWQGANSVLDHRDLARQAEAAQQASRAFYHRWFPTEKKVINPRLQMQQHLQTLTRQAQHAPLVDRLSALQNILSETPGIRLRALSWDAAGNRLQLDIAAVSSRALEQFTQRAQPRFRVRPGDMITKPDSIEGQLTLEENDG
ncbi:type II secretion system protein GspL [Klebsiella pneumoniae]|uniref:type II secretion system protein GspL n=1 Tax=Klebsiella pneumoniae TaxID=573 RepID=UPI00388D6D6B